MRQMTEDQFDEAFDVVPDPVTGDIVRPTDQGLDRASRYLWTVVDADGDLYAVSGWHYVNRVGYVITQQPWDEDTEAEWFVSPEEDDPEDQP